MRITFIIPAHDEAGLLPATLRALRESIEIAALADPEVIVVDDASADATAAIAAEHGAEVVRIDKRQISAARNAGAVVATGDVLIFIDADTIVNAQAIREAADAIAAGAEYAGAPIRFDEPCPRWVKVMLPVFLFVYRRMRLAPGCFFVVRRDRFEEVGGFDDTVYAAEEALLARALKRAGARHAFGHTPVITSGRKLRDHSLREIVGTIARMALRGKRAVTSREGLEMWYGEE